MSAPTRPTPTFFTGSTTGNHHPRWGRSPVDSASTFRLASHSPEECWDSLRPRHLPHHPWGRGDLPHPHCVPGNLCKGQSCHPRTPALSPWSKNSVLVVWSGVSQTQKVCFEPLCPMGSLKGRCWMTSPTPQNKLLCPYFQIKPLRGELGLPYPTQAPSGLAADTYRIGLSCYRKLSFLPAELALFLPGVSHAACPVGNRLNE